MSKQRKDDFADKLKGFGDRIQSEPANVPMQQVVPTAPAKSGSTPTVPEKQLHTLIPGDLMKKLKLRAVQDDTDQKAIVIAALELYLNT